MTTKNTTPSLTVKTGASAYLQGRQVAIFEPGTAIYEKLRIGSEIDVTVNGEKGTGKVISTNVGALINLIYDHGRETIYVADRAYSPLGLVQELADAAGGDVLDVTKLYTSVTVQLNFPQS